ncbi:MAG: PfkB family carbohydrate kinase [Sulfuricurvum sp.]|jgi:rfaE bifunctional protein kinase chain/domain
MNKTGKTVFVHGKFEVLHPGHQRLLKFAKESGDILEVGVYADSLGKYFVPEDLRLEAVQSSIFVDKAVLLDTTPEEYIKKTKPDIVVKGNEHETHFNPELEILKEYGGKLIFSSGDSRFSSIELLRAELQNIDLSSIHKPIDFCDRHHFKYTELKTIVNRFDTLKTIVIGDTIIDEYIACEALGMSQEDPTIVVSPLFSEKYLGGAGIVAAHTKGLGSKVSFFTVLGCDEASEFAKEKLVEYGITFFCYPDDTRPTNLKQRFRAGNKTLLRVNHLKQHHISIEHQAAILKDLEEEIKDAQVLIFSDFSYGCLPQTLVNSIIDLGKKHDVIMCADSQSSSQTGDISRFNDMTLVTPTEREIRLAVDDFESGLIVLSDKLKVKSNPRNIFITLASEGVIINKYNSNDEFFTDRLPAMNNNPKDVAGAGDSMISTASLALAVGATIWEASYLASIAAACQVSRIGNLPLQKADILKELDI